VEGARSAERAMELLREGGVAFGVNIVLTRATLPGLPGTVARAEALGAREAQLLRYKPKGRAESASYLATRLSPEQIEGLLPLLSLVSADRTIALRIYRAF